MTGYGPHPVVPQPVAPLSPVAVNFLRLLATAVADGARAAEAPASNWLECYRVRRCACGTATAVGAKCRGCGGSQ